MKRITLTKAAGFGLIAVGILVLGLSVGLNIRQYQEKAKIVADFKEKRTRIAAAGGDPKAETRDPERDPLDLEEGVLYLLRIPVIDSENPVVEGTSSDRLSTALGHETATVSPGDGGNCVIAGHRNYSFGKYFNRLDEVAIGDMLYIDTATDTYGYRVSEIRTVEPTETEILESVSGKEQLTLYTCTPIYIATHRLVIVADRVQ